MSNEECFSNEGDVSVSCLGAESLMVPTPLKLGSSLREARWSKVEACLPSWRDCTRQFLAKNRGFGLRTYRSI